MNAILQVENLTKQYADFKLDHVSFSVPKGTIMGLIGENGAGKSTTMGSRRFEITETAGSVKGFYVVVDRETGVNYLVAKFGTGGGICPLIDKDGKPIISE